MYLMKIEILGPGCANCQKLMTNVEKALGEMDVQAELEKITELPRILERGVLTTPALSIDGKVVMTGRVPSVEEIKKIVHQQIS